MELYSRKFSGKEQLIDVLTRGLERSNPQVLNRIASFRPQLKCKLCGEEEHTLRSCPNRQNAVPSDPYDELFSSVAS